MSPSITTKKGICEVFTNTGKHGGCPSQSEAVGRLASLSLRSGIGIEDVMKQLKGIRCPSTIRQQGLVVLSCPDAIARVLEQAEKAIRGEKSLVTETEEPKIPEGVSVTLDSAQMRFCPECGAAVVHEGGCVICPQCGFSKCS